MNQNFLRDINLQAEREFENRRAKGGDMRRNLKILINKIFN